MDHCVAVRAHGDEISNGIDLAFALQLTDRHEVVHVNEACADLHVYQPEIEAAGSAVKPWWSMQPSLACLLRSAAST